MTDPIKKYEQESSCLNCSLYHLCAMRHQVTQIIDGFDFMLKGESWGMDRSKGLYDYIGRNCVYHIRQQPIDDDNVITGG